MNKVLKALAVSFVVIFARLLPLSPIVGSSHAYFSYSSIFAPVIAAQCGLSWVLAFVFCKKLWIAPSLMIVFHKVPLLCSARVFQKREMVFSFVLPAICMMLFVAHPIGAQAWPYALYWLIPIMLCFAPDVVWTRALQSSFVAHAVGSVVWLYAGAISAQVWMSLIPLVVCERLIIAVGMVVCNEICNAIVCGFKKLKGKLVFTLRSIFATQKNSGRTDVGVKVSCSEISVVLKMPIVDKVYLADHRKSV